MNKLFVLMKNSRAKLAAIYDNGHMPRPGRRTESSAVVIRDGSPPLEVQTSITVSVLTSDGTRIEGVPMTMVAKLIEELGRR